MTRIISIVVGIGFTVAVLWAFAFGVGPAFSTFAKHGQFVEPTAELELHKVAHGPEGGFSFDGPFGKWDYAQLQRGYKVYKEVCAACHSLQYVAFRNLEELTYSEAEVKAEAAQYQIPKYNPATAEVTTVPGLPTDHFPPVPYFGTGHPPDLSLITKARHDGSNYVYSLLTGYGEPDPEVLAEFPDFEVPAGMSFNPYFANVNIAMAPPLTTDGQVTYADGTEATVSQMAKDVSAFLTWTAEPTLVKRKQTGWPVLGFLLFATILAYLSKKQIWASLKPRKKD